MIRVRRKTSHLQEKGRIGACVPRFVQKGRHDTMSSSKQGSLLPKSNQTHTARTAPLRVTCKIPKIFRRLSPQLFFTLPACPPRKACVVIGYITEASDK